MCKFVTNEGTFNNYPVSLETASVEMWVDCIIDQDIDNQLIRSKILSKKTLKKLEMPNNYTNTMKFAPGDHVKAKLEDGAVVNVEITDIDPVEYACQLSGEYECEMETDDGPVNIGHLHESQLRTHNETNDDWEIDTASKIWYNVNRAKVKCWYFYY